MPSRASITRVVPWALLFASLVANLLLVGQGRRERGDSSGLRDRGPERAGPPRAGRADEPSRCEARLAQLLAAERARLALELR